ncbi:hypothetical protein ACFU76_07475 [Streptomyces sp. NPDC057539]|uniref:hypothetical protein n=1 Tax=Streptomyces sp. NPDC057539 TaxID=3346159 RepID=UPI0036CBB73E
MLAGVSADYYASHPVLDALARALCLNDAEIGHLHDLAPAAAPSPNWRRSRPALSTLRPSLHRNLDAHRGAGVNQQPTRGDLLAANPLGRALRAAHDVRLHNCGTKHICHPDVGDLEWAPAPASDN